ncbi:MAG: dephospho-CoA kinase [Bacteroidales bacterium]|jgi:dephospho-CoA kinase|nr:dephospho-CoA kinase [Bacteroidales bacterium]
MIIAGLTGGIGSGKSTIADIFANLGAPVYNADFYAKWLLNNSEELKDKLTKAFGNDIYNNNQINRKHFASIIFSDKEKLALSNSIIHPVVFNHFNKWVESQPNGTKYVIKESAILYESGADKLTDVSITVVADKATRIERVCKRDNVSEELVIDRINNQMTDEERINLADMVIDNNNNKMIVNQVLEIHKQLIKR